MGSGKGGAIFLHGNGTLIDPRLTGHGRGKLNVHVPENELDPDCVAEDHPDMAEYIFSRESEIS